MTKVSKSPRHKQAPAPATRAAARVALRCAARPRIGGFGISARLTSGLSIAHTAPVEPSTVRRTRQVIAEMLASREKNLKANGVARKWRRKGLKRLNPRPEMVVARKPRTYKIRYSRTAESAAMPDVSGPVFALPMEGARGATREIFRLASP